MKIEIEHEGSYLGCNCGTGRPIVRDAVAKGDSVVALVRSKARAYDLAGADLIEADDRDESALTFEIRLCPEMTASSRAVLQSARLLRCGRISNSPSLTVFFGKLLTPASRKRLR